MTQRIRGYYLVAAGFMLLLVCPAYGQPSAPAEKACPNVDVRKLSVSTETVAPKQTETGPLLSSNTPNSAEGTISVVALGPILGAMDSTDIRTELTCTPKGFLLTATVTRSADFHGAVLANVNWRPRIEMIVVPQQPDVLVQTMWKIRLTTGAELDRAATPPYTEIKYPISSELTIRGLK